MGKPTGFLEYERETAKVLPPKVRIANFKEFRTPLNKEKQKLQGARCMACGVPFCQSGMMTGGHPADHAAEQLCIQHHLAGFLDIGFDGGHDAHFQIVAGEVELEAFGFQQDTFQHRDGRTHGDGFGHTIDGCAQQNFITYDVQTEFSPLFSFLMLFCV